MATINSSPYAWPYDGDLRPGNTALVIIDMQTDFCGQGGYVDAMGYDIQLTRAPIAPLQQLLPAMRTAGFHIIHTREGHRPDLANHAAALAMIKMQGGVFGAVATSADLLAVLQH